MVQSVSVFHSLLLTNNILLYGYSTFIYLLSTSLFIHLLTFGLFPLWLLLWFLILGIMHGFWMRQCQEHRVTWTWAQGPILLLISSEFLVKLYCLRDPSVPHSVRTGILCHTPRHFGLMWGLNEITVEQLSISWISSHIVWAFPWNSCMFYIKVIWVVLGYYTLF